MAEKPARKVTFYQKYLLPGVVFQALVISGGYGTGAELTQFFLARGLMGALLGLGVTLMIWAAVCAVTYEFARVFRAYNYRAAFRRLLGRGWLAYDACYIVMALLSLGVIAATAALATHDLTGAPGWIGSLLISAAIIALVLAGTHAVENFLSYVAYALYGVYAIFLIVCFVRFGGAISGQLFAAPEIHAGWATGGAQYAFYNLGIIPATLFSVRYAENRRQAVTAGVMAAVIAVIPALALVVAMSGLYPGVLTAEAPVTAVFHALDMPLLRGAFQIVLVGSLIDTGAGMIKAVSDRFEHIWQEKRRTPPEWVRPVVAGGLMCAGVWASTLGLTRLVAHGYGGVAWAFLIVYVAPMLTIGVWKIRKMRKKL
jgi:uncharacterized membrane protein YkvI